MSQEMSHFFNLPDELHSPIFKHISVKEFFLLRLVSQLFYKKVQTSFSDRFSLYFPHSDIKKSDNWPHIFWQTHKNNHQYYQYPNFDFTREPSNKSNTPFTPVHKEFFDAVKEGFIEVILNLIQSGKIQAKDLFVRDRCAYSAMNWAGIFPDIIIREKMLEIFSNLLKEEKSKHVKIDAYSLSDQTIYYDDDTIGKTDQGPDYFHRLGGRINNELITIGCPIVFNILFELFKEDNIPEKIKTGARFPEGAHIRLDVPQFLYNSIAYSRHAFIAPLLDIAKPQYFFRNFIAEIKRNCGDDMVDLKMFISAKKSHEVVLDFLLKNNRQAHFVQYAILCMDYAISKDLDNAETFKFVCHCMNENSEGAKNYFQYKTPEQVKTVCQYLKKQYEKDPQVWQAPSTEYVALLEANKTLPTVIYEELRLVISIKPSAPHL